MLGVVAEQRTSMVGFLQFINNDVGIVGAPLWLVTLAALGRHSRHPLLWSSSTSCEHVSWNEHELSHRLSISYPFESLPVLRNPLSFRVYRSLRYLKLASNHVDLDALPCVTSVSSRVVVSL
jgi:hypothetical protein